MVFRRQHDIFCACIFEQFCPFIWLEKLGFKLICEVLVFDIWPKSLVMKICKEMLRLIRLLPATPVPFRIAIVHPHLVSCRRTISRHRVQSPVNEYAKFRIFKPARYWAAVDGFPVVLVGFLGECVAREKAKCQN